MNRDTLYYLERLDSYEIMETHIMDRVMQEYWSGNLDASGSFFENSTAFGILRYAYFDFAWMKDYEFERENRFYNRKY